MNPNAYLAFTESMALTAFRSWLLSILPAGVEVVKGQANRVPEPVGGDFVVFTPILRGRLATNDDEYNDAIFTGSVAGTTLTVTAVAHGKIMVGAPLAQAPGGPTVLAGTYIVAILTGEGGVGTYTVSQAQTISSGTLLAGVKTMLQPTELTVQTDVHGPNSADNMQVISTTWRDAMACQYFRTVADIDMQPLYATDPAQRPFENAEDQYEFRWSSDLHLQVNPVVSTGQAFAATLTPTLISVDASFLS